MITNYGDATLEVVIMQHQASCNFYKPKHLLKVQGDSVTPPISTICDFMKHQAICNYNKL